MCGVVLWVIYTTFLYTLYIKYIFRHMSTWCPKKTKYNIFNTFNICFKMAYCVIHTIYIIFYKCHYIRFHIIYKQYEFLKMFDGILRHESCL